MIEKGAWLVLKAIKSIPELSAYQLGRARDYYEKIIAAAFNWQRSGMIERKAKKYKEGVRIPLKEKMSALGKQQDYQDFLKILKEKMLQAASEENFEKAILWRDAIWKLENKKKM